MLGGVVSVEQGVHRLHVQYRDRGTPANAADPVQLWVKVMVVLTQASMLDFLAERLMKNSDNTANDMLHHTTGLLRPQQTADSLGLCNTRLLLTTKAFWTAEAGMGGKHFPRANLLKSALAFGSADRARQIAIAQDLVQTSLKVNADQLLEALDGKNGYFLKRYDARIDLNTQNTSTPREFTLLVVHPFKAGKLSKSSLQFTAVFSQKGAVNPTPCLSRSTTGGPRTALAGGCSTSPVIWSCRMARSLPKATSTMRANSPTPLL